MTGVPVSRLASSVHAMQLTGGTDETFSRRLARSDKVCMASATPTLMEMHDHEHLVSLKLRLCMYIGCRAANKVPELSLDVTFGSKVAGCSNLNVG